MGICQSEERRRHRKVSAELAAAARDQVFKLLLLGTGESGKSTIYKQISCLYGAGFSREYRLNAVSSIHNQMLKTLKTMLGICERMGYPLPEDLAKSRDYIVAIDENESVTQEVAWHMGQLWNDESVRRALVPIPILVDETKSGGSFAENDAAEAKESPLYFYFPDSTEYLFKQLHTISDPAYVPSNADLFRVRIPTTGILETTFQINGAKFLLVDVGGQRNERRKWIHCFEAVKAVIYVVAISEYDQQLYEESRVNRVLESLEVFKRIAQETFPKTTIIVFFNKIDLFKEKIKRVEVKRYFRDYDGPEGDYDQLLKYFQKLYYSAGQLPNSERKIFFLPTCATDTKAAKKIFDVVKETVVTEYLRKSSLIS